METNEKQFRKEFKTVSNIWAKREFQTMLKAVRAQNLTVTKIDSGYTIHAQNGVLLLRAMNGTRGYLVRMVKNLFEPAPVKASDLF